MFVSQKNGNAIIELLNRGYSVKHVCIILGCIDKYIWPILKYKERFEPTIKFLTQEQKQSMYVLDTFLELKPASLKWDKNCYYHITILKYLGVPRDVIYDLYKSAPLRQVALAHKERYPIFQSFDFHCFGLTAAEYESFVRGCYIQLKNPEKWR